MASAPANIAARTIAGTSDNKVEEPGRPRKRGAELEQAIRDATVAELACAGYGALTIESVAARAQTGKASIYRRWPTKQELVFDSMNCLMAGPMASVESVQLGEQTSTRDALLELTMRAAESMCGARGDAMRSMMSESLRDPGFSATFEDQVHDPRKAALNEILERGVSRGEVRPDALEGMVMDVLGGAVVHRYLVRRLPADRNELAAFIDGFVMPALRP